MADPDRNREELISSFVSSPRPILCSADPELPQANKLFSTMLGEVVMDAALQSHRDIMRRKAVCSVCGTR